MGIVATWTTVRQGPPPPPPATERSRAGPRRHRARLRRHAVRDQCRRGSREGPTMTATGERRASAADAAILELVRRRSETSRVEISRELGVTPATVTYAVKRLLAAELLVESGFASSRGGKRASLLRLNDQARWAIGCTVDTDRLSLVGVDMSGALRSRIALPLAAAADAAEVSDRKSTRLNSSHVA